MKKLKFICISIILLLPVLLHAQILKPVKWSFAVKQAKEGEAVLEFTAKIDKGFHVYSQFVDANAGPIPTTFEFKKSTGYELIGKVTEGKAIEEFDQNFGTNLKYFANNAVFKQKIKIKSKNDFKLAGVLNFMVCNDKMCLPPEDVDFEFNIKGNTNDKTSIIEKLEEKAIPAENLAKKDTANKNKLDTSHQATGNMPTVQMDTKPVGKTVSMSVWAIFISGFLGGLVALLTPCVFPMIPLTVSFFTKRSHNKAEAISRASTYGLSIILIYDILGFGVTKLLGADALNDLASNGIFNMIFFLLLVVFAVSFLGAFEITLPSKWVNAADAQSEKKGMLGIFFMAFTLALVSFSCTGPIIGTLLVEAAAGRSAIGPLMGMTGFSLALALPFTLFAAFPSWLKSLPKSGGWLNSVKVVLGFLELALAFKFLSNVDLAYHWRILDREVFLVLWIIIFAMLGFYLLGKLKFSHDSDIPYVSIPRFIFAVLSLSFALYMVPGLWGAPLKAISAFSPPQANQDFDLSRVSTGICAVNPTIDATPKKHAEIFHCPHGLNCFFDYDEALAYAKKVNKPLFIDFTGWSCVNCRKMEVSVWSDPQVLKRLNEDYVMVSLYVDDKTELSEGEKYISTFSNRKVKTLGNKWSDLQAARFNTNSQPYYVLLDDDGNLLTQPHAFDLNIDAYIKFLDEGKINFTQKKK